jgi:hypothetical protein
LEVLIVHHDLDTAGAVLVPLPPDRDEEAREEPNREYGQQQTAIVHAAPCSPENNKTRVKRALLPSRSRLPYYRVWATMIGVSRTRPTSRQTE